MDNCQKNRILKIGRIALAVIWGSIILVCLFYRKRISVNSILQYTPDNPWLAAGIMLCLFALKSLSVVLYSGILYVVSGILFPIPAAVFINLLGTVIMLTLPYLIGRKTGGPFIKSIQAKYPIIEKLRDLRKKNEVIFCFAARIMRIPGDIVSLYMGAAQVNYKKYLLGSILGAIPHTITYPIMGMSAFNLSSSQFILAFCAEVIYFLMTTVIYTIYTRKHYRKFK